ncbi:MAG: hypothetical protein IPH31_07030 [Lewinellaceae bacterium]|nr:hypothetical protein [Lewinellaceae bacterium]
MFQKLLFAFDVPRVPAVLFAVLGVFTKHIAYWMPKLYIPSELCLVKTPNAAEKPVLRLQAVGRVVFFLTLFSSTLLAQTSPEAKKPHKDGKSMAVLAHFALGGHMPAGDLAKRFGVNGSLGGGTELITSKNWIFGLEGAFIFGSRVKDDPLSILRTPSGDIIGNDRAIANTRLQERGLYLGATIGKLLTFNEERAGLRLTFGGGWAQHSIRVIDDSRSVVQIRDDYKKGYDRLCGGPALQQFIGWQKVGYGRDMSWLFGFEFNQAFTQTRRDWDFAEMRKLEGRRVDLRFGIRLAWTLPFYTGTAEEIYY